MRAARLIHGHPILGLSLLITAILAFAISQRVKEPLTIPVMDSMAVAADDARSRSDNSQPVGYPVVGLPAATAEAPGAPAPPARDPLLGEIHVSSGDTASRPADPSTTHPLRIGYAVGAQSSSVRVTVSADDGAAVATVLDSASVSAGASYVEWTGTNAGGSPVPSGRYTLTVEASHDTDVYWLSVRHMHLYVARPEWPSG
jgi:hypothetical protein